MSHPPDDSLSRLLRAAARREPAETVSPSPRLVRQVLVEWKSVPADEFDRTSTLFAKWAAFSASGLAASLLLLNLSTLDSIQRANGWRAADLQTIDAALQARIP